MLADPYTTMKRLSCEAKEHMGETISHAGVACISRFDASYIRSLSQHLFARQV